MKRFLRWFSILAFLTILAGVGSYAGLRVRVGTLLGDASSAFSLRTIRFGKDSIPDVGRELVWTVSWGRVTMPGTRRATIWVSPTGTVIATEPTNLRERVQRWNAREP